VRRSNAETSPQSGATGVMTRPLEGKTALVTGSSRGIGRAIVERLAADGAAVVVNYNRSARHALEVVGRIEARGGRAQAIPADVADPAQVKRLFYEAERTVGPLDIVIANAGVFLSKPLADSEEEDYDRVFDTNTRGVFYTLREAGRRIQDGGRIIVVSTGGTRMHMANVGLYLGSKGAIEQFARSLSRELGPRHVTVNVLSPGFTDTEMLSSDEVRALGATLSPFNRIGAPEDVAGVAAFLAGDSAGWVTGQNVQAGGGVV
jgi:3-oxoacyl-[acyl-carrier protein] reductase